MRLKELRDVEKIFFDVHELENILKIWDTWACLPKKSECILQLFGFSSISPGVGEWTIGNVCLQRDCDAGGAMERDVGGI